MDPQQHAGLLSRFGIDPQQLQSGGYDQQFQQQAQPGFGGYQPGMDPTMQQPDFDQQLGYGGYDPNQGGGGYGQDPGYDPNQGGGGYGQQQGYEQQQGYDPNQGGGRW